MAGGNGCKGKVRHRSKGAAVAALRAIRNAGLESYPCKRCGGWHLANSRKPHKVQARIDQLLKRHKPVPSP